MLLRELWLFVSLFLILVGLAAQQGPLVSVGVLVFLGGGVSRLWSRLSLERLNYERFFAQKRAFVGEKLPFTLRLTNRKVLPLPWVEVQDRFPDRLPLEGVRLRPSPLASVLFFQRSTSVSWYERVSWSYEANCVARGYYQVGPALIRSGDVFGFFRRERSKRIFQILREFFQFFWRETAS